MNVCVIGTGYVGLVTGAAFADLGNQVVCVDIDAEKVEKLNAGEPTIYEPGLKEMLARNLREERISFTTDIGAGVRSGEVVFIAVGTPPGPDGEPDISQVVEVAHKIAEHIDSYKVIVNKSTVPIGTGDLVGGIIEKNRKQKVGFDVVSNPEFLREGSAIVDTLNPDRIVIGASSKTVAMKLLELYSPLERPMLITDVTSAEVIKYASNAFLASKISFINALSRLCEEVGGDILQVSKGMGWDRRIGDHFLQAGLGFGGSCFGKDVKALVHIMSSRGCDCSLMETVLRINDTQPLRFVDRLKEHLGGLKGRKIAVLGLAFKPETDDLRDAKSIDVIGRLLAEGAVVQAYDPIATENARKIFPQITYAENPYEAVEDASAMLLITEWAEFKSLDFTRIHRLMSLPVVFDGRNLYSPKDLACLGFDYFSIGRKPVLAAEQRDCMAA